MKTIATCAFGTLLSLAPLAQAADVAPSPAQQQQRAEQGQDSGRTGEAKQSLGNPEERRKEQERQGRSPDLQGKERKDDTGRTPPPASDAGAGTVR